MATYTYDLEDVCWQVIDYLQDNMETKLDAIEAVKAVKTIPLDDIQRFYFGDLEAVPSIQNLPAIVVKGRGWVPVPTSLDARFRDDLRIEVECYIGSDANAQMSVAGQNYVFEEVMDMKIMRYARAIVEILIENEELGGYATLIVTGKLPW